MNGGSEASNASRRGGARAAVLGAFVGLVLSRRYGEIRVGDIIANAGVARSTFYEHFRRKEDVLLAAMEPILLPLRDAANGHADQERLGAVLRHLWDKRALARILFESTAGPLIQRHLAEMIAPRLTDDRPAARALLSRACAAGQLTMLRMWLAGEVSCPSEQMAMHLCRIAPCEPAGIA